VGLDSLMSGEMNRPKHHFRPMGSSRSLSEQIKFRAWDWVGFSSCILSPPLSTARGDFSLSRGRRILSEGLFYSWPLAL